MSSTDPTGPRHDPPHSYVRSYEVTLTVTVESISPTGATYEPGNLADYLTTKAMCHWPARTAVSVAAINQVSVAEQVTT